MARKLWRRTLTLTLLAVAATCATALGEQASQPSDLAAGLLSTGDFHSCALRSGAVRCWGLAKDGQLGYGNVADIGDDEVPAAAGTLNLGAGRTATAISAGAFHGCAVLDNAALRCWGFGGDGRLGYANINAIGDNEPPAAAGPVDLGAGRTAKAVSAGFGSSCAILDNGTVRCWGFGEDGRLGYGNPLNVGDDETPAMAGPVNLGTGRTATAISVGNSHTCALLDDANVRCWGFGGSGRLGYGGGINIGDNESPAAFGPVDLGSGRSAKAISAGEAHTCAILDNGDVRCWGFGGNGQLGYANTSNVGAVVSPGAVGPVDLGAGRTAKAISAGGEHTCAILDNGGVRCWGANGFGQLGYANKTAIGDDEHPGDVGPVDLGTGRTAIAISAADLHTCALLDDMSVRCWGYGAQGRLGLCNQLTVGDDETPGSVGPVDLGAGGAGCAPPAGATPPPPPPPAPAGTPVVPIAPPPPPAPVSAGTDLTEALRAQTARGRAFRACLRAAARRPRSVRTREKKQCSKRYGRTPGRVVGLRATALSKTSVRLTWSAPGSDGSRNPAARGFFVKESRRPIATRRAFSRAGSLCRPACTFQITRVGAKISLTVTDLRPRTTYYYKVAARDNVTHRVGPRSLTARVRTK